MAFYYTTSIGKILSAITKGIVTAGSGLLGLGAGGASTTPTTPTTPTIPDVPPDTIYGFTSTLGTNEILIMAGVALLALYGAIALIRGPRA